MAVAVPKDRIAQRISTRQLRAWGLPLFCAALAMVGTGESLRLILEGGTPEARSSGWYLLVVSALVAVGIFARPEGASAPPPSTMVPAVALEEPRASVEREPEPKNHTREAVILFLGASLFVWALPWLGFAVANGLFVAAYLVWVDHRRWYFALVAAVLVDAFLVVGLNLLKVLLPTGALGLGF